MRRFAPALVVLFVTLVVSPTAFAQQRPLSTEDPEPIGAGRLLIEGGLDLANNAEYPVSGLEGNLLRLPTVGVSVGISSIAEFQIDGGFYDRLVIDTRNPNAPLASAVTATGDHTHDVSDFVVATKIRFMSEAAGPLIAPCAWTIASWVASASNLLGAVTNFSPVSREISAAAFTANSRCVLTPVPTAVPPSASSARCGSVDST